MEIFQQLNEIISSWERCIELGISSEISYPKKCVSNENLQVELDSNKLLISTFENSIKKVETFLTDSKYLFLLTNSKGLLLKKNPVRI